MSNRSLVSILVLVGMVVVLVIALLLMRIKFNEDYANAKAAIEERQIYIIATALAATDTLRPSPVFVPSVTPLPNLPTVEGLVLPTRFSP